MSCENLLCNRKSSISSCSISGDSRNRAVIAIATSLETGLFEIIFDIANIMGWSGAVSMADAPTDQQQRLVWLKWDKTIAVVAFDSDKARGRDINRHGDSHCAKIFDYVKLETNH
ncbi:hypothetical protein DY000_02025589 [Brassica cretica]|uniref:Uncharacterized protein n=1 Tax=Brassica cretica TaxID=69181 RepID=A0ABQ7EKK1_BRACR|nr:hypothetical protein DY000_02025589 [Brassica cretica]